MTEPFAPLSDEDLSAALDGMADPDVEARIQADPSAQARLAALRAASEAIGQAPVSALDPGVVDALIARAVEVGTGPAPDAPLITPPTTPDGVVTPLAPRRGSPAGLQRWLVAAVVVALVAIGLGLVYSGTHTDGNEDTAIGAQEDRNAARAEDPSQSAADDAGASSSDDPSDHADTEKGPEPELDDNAREPADLDELGSFDDVGSLRTVLRTGFPQDASVVDGDRPSNAAVTRCNDFIQTVLGDVTLSVEPDEVGQATVAGDPYLVYEFLVEGSSVDGSKLITAADPDSCDLLFTFVR